MRRATSPRPCFSSRSPRSRAESWPRPRPPCAASATLAESLGALPTLWPSRALLGALLEESSPAESAKSLASARSGVIAIADDLPDDLRDVWLDRPDVAALLGG